MPDTAPPRARLGRALDLLGQLGLPLALGAALGFYAADMGVPLLPTMVQLLALLCLVSALLVAVGKVLRGRAWEDAPGGARLRRRVVAVLVLGALALAVQGFVFHAREQTPLTTLSAEEYATAFELDAARYRDLDRSMEEVLVRLESEPWMAVDEPLTVDQEAVLLESWAALWTASVELDELRRYWEDWYRFDPSRAQRQQHLSSFLLTFAAELSLYEKAARMEALVEPHRSADKLLDAPRPELGLQRTSWSLYRQELLGSRDQARVLAGERYLDALALGMRGQHHARTYGLTWLWEDVEAHLQVIDDLGKLDRATALVSADTQIFQRRLRRAWYPAQREVAEAMGDTRTRRIGWYMIPEDGQQAVMELAQPGDVLLARKNWYLSNAGLPGFWPHAILYLGTPEQLKAWSDTPEVRAWVQAETGVDGDLGDLLEARHPAAWRRYQGEIDGHPAVLLEATSEGVGFNSMPHAAGDYLVDLRPRLSVLARAQAIAAAFTHVDKPYDYDFDFDTDAALVCTELVWRAYRPAEGKEGLDLPLVRMAGRPTLPANEVARIYARQQGQADRAFDFVAFVDGSERDCATWLGTEADFLQSPDRTRWDVATRSAPPEAWPCQPPSRGGSEHR